MKMIAIARRMIMFSALAVSLVFSMNATVFANGLVKIAEGDYSCVDEKNPSPATGCGLNAGIVIGKDRFVDTLTSAKNQNGSTGYPVNHGQSDQMRCFRGKMEINKGSQLGS